MHKIISELLLAIAFPFIYFSCYSQNEMRSEKMQENKSGFKSMMHWKNRNPSCIYKDLYSGT